MDTYEKKYNEAMLRADEAVQKGCLDKDMFDIIFPPEESEDEKIRKDLIYDIERLPMQGVLTHRPTSEYIAYLEKQEQKPPVDVDPCDASCDAYYQRGLNKGYELGLEAGRKKQKPISSCDIVPYIDEKIAALQDMWREEKVSFDWDDMKDMIEDVARHFYHKEQKPSTGIYWHAIKRGEKLPCRAYIWNPDYEKYHDCWEGRLIPNLENISVGGDTWYLPADDVKNLPREGLDGLQKEQKPNSTEDMPYIADERFYEREPADSFKYKLAEYMTKCCTKKEGPYGYTYGISAESILKMAEEELLKRGAVQKPAEWSEADEDRIRQIERIAQQAGCTQKLQEEIHDWLKDLRPSWKPSEEQMGALSWMLENARANIDFDPLKDLYEQLKKL